MIGSFIFRFNELIFVFDPFRVKSPVTVKLSLTVTSDVALPILIGTLDVDVPILIPSVVSLVFNSILPVPLVINNPSTVDVPIPTLP